MEDVNKPDPIIRTKLRLPFTRPGLVSRPRLQEQIAQGLRGPLTLITAPAGFGKTTLVASCIAGCGLPVAWLSLDKDDNQAGRFLTYLVAALQAADPTIGGEAAQLLAGIQQAPSEAVLTSLINDLDGATGERPWCWMITSSFVTRGCTRTWLFYSSIVQLPSTC